VLIRGANLSSFLFYFFLPKSRANLASFHRKQGGSNHAQNVVGETKSGFASALYPKKNGRVGEREENFLHLLIRWGSFSDDITTTGIGFGELNA
jgi:hypothetical protein